VTRVTPGAVNVQVTIDEMLGPIGMTGPAGS